jgi:superfamily II DNA helicase RecQ
MSDAEYLKSRGVVNLIHFTPADNLPGILTDGIIPRNLLEQNGTNFTFTDEFRMDGNEHVNLSITNPNISMFYRFRVSSDHVFVVLTLDVSLLDEYEGKISYTSTNAASNRSMRCSVEELFTGNRDGRKENWTTDNQAEVLVVATVHPKYIKTIEFPVVGHEPAEAVRQFYENAKLLVEQHRLKAKLVIHNEKFIWNRRIVGYGYEEACGSYYESWKADFAQFEQLSKAVSEFKWSTIFDTFAFTRDDLENWNKDNFDSNRQNVAQWRLDYYKPQDVETRPDNTLSAIAVIEKIILRGRITVVSKTLEDRIAGNHVNMAHQIQATVIELVKHQKIKPFMRMFIDVEEDCKDAAYESIKDIKELSKNVCGLYQCNDLLDGVSCIESRDKADLIIGYSEPTQEREKITAVITQITQGNDVIDFDFTRVQNPVAINPKKETLEYLLNYIFGFPKFRENQIDGIIRGLMREDSIILLPTGSGKSVVFQLLSLITPGIAIVVSPIISLIEDQISNLYNRGIDRVIGISSAMDKDGKNSAIEGITKGQFLVSYVSPERFQNRVFINAIKHYTNTNIISAVAIDEAHCVSEWGHDFRTAYLGLAQTCRRICNTGKAIPPLLALTGTASASVLRDMQHDLGIIGDDAIIQPSSFDRPEIVYRLYSAPSNKKQVVLEEIIKRKLPLEFKEGFDTFYQPSKGGDTNCGLVFCQNVNGSYGLLATESALRHGHPGVADVLEKILPGKVELYSGKAPKRLNLPDNKWNDQKRHSAARFKSNEQPIIVCTKAFGMGIDKPNVRWIIHYGISGSLEAYYQEAGRAARDQKTAYAFLILSDDYPELNRKMLNPGETNVEDIGALEESKGEWKGDDISRSLFFHTSAFDGIASEMQRVRNVLDQCNQRTWRNQRFHVPFMGSKTETEKAIYRLQLLGFFSSYSVDYHGYGNGTFVIEARKFDREEIIENYIDYIRAYQDNDDYADAARSVLNNAVDGLDGREFIIKVVETLLREFTYKVVEEGRRRAISNMLDTAKSAASCKTDKEADAEFRRLLLAYLHTDKADGKKSAKLQDVINNATDIELLDRVVRTNKTKIKKENLLGETDRWLEAYPQHYGLHYIQAYSYMCVGDYSGMIDAIKSMARFGKQSYGLDEQRVQNDVLGFLNSKDAKTIRASTWNSIVPQISESLSLTERELYTRLNTEQAIVSEKVNSMYKIADIVRNRRNADGNH